MELFFDLVFVVAVAQAVAQVAHAAESGRVVQGLVTFAMVFFSIWWAWMNFTWFASAYDVDDGPYRLLVMLQMGGVVILAAGIDSAAKDNDLTVITLGYVVMRVALITQWLRAARSDPGGRATAHRYAIGIGLVQVGWLIRLALPVGWAVPTFVVLAACELFVAWFAERANRTGWHPHHIAERYSLFTIILLGESVRATVDAVQLGISTHGFGWELGTVAACGLVIVFALWWLYFLDPMGLGLEQRRWLAFRWGYGHVGIFVGLALLGAGFDLTVSAAADVEGAGEAAEHLSTLVVGYSLAGPIALYLLVLWAMVSMSRGRWAYGPLVAVGAGLVLCAPLLALAGAGIVVICVVVAALTAALTAAAVTDRHRRAEQYPAD
jgi:low temperature requirement protein LtrA